jgi:hypothetical protein
MCTGVRGEAWVSVISDESNLSRICVSFIQAQDTRVACSAQNVVIRQRTKLNRTYDRGR